MAVVRQSPQLPGHHRTSPVRTRNGPPNIPTDNPATIFHSRIHLKTTIPHTWAIITSKVDIRDELEVYPALIRHRSESLFACRLQLCGVHFDHAPSGSPVYLSNRRLRTDGVSFNLLRRPYPCAAARLSLHVFAFCFLLNLASSLFSLRMMNAVWDASGTFPKFNDLRHFFRCKLQLKG
jgi:hypothetical protein